MTLYKNIGNLKGIGRQRWKYSEETKCDNTGSKIWINLNGVREEMAGPMNVDLPAFQVFR